MCRRRARSSIQITKHMLKVTCLEQEIPRNYVSTKLCFYFNAKIGPLKTSQKTDNSCSTKSCPKHL